MGATKIGETTHENANSEYRLCVSDGLRLSSIRYELARLSKGVLEKRPLRLRRHSGELITISRPYRMPRLGIRR